MGGHKSGHNFFCNTPKKMSVEITFLLTLMPSGNFKQFLIIFVRK